jgi:poly(3-hydroxybutyrate) depolymerase
MVEPQRATGRRASRSGGPGLTLRLVLIALAGACEESRDAGEVAGPQPALAEPAAADARVLQAGAAGVAASPGSAADPAGPASGVPSEPPVPSESPAPDEPAAVPSPGEPAPAPTPTPVPGDMGSSPPECPSTAVLTPGDSTQSLRHEDRDRTYVVHVPASYTGMKVVPLVLDFHGRGGSGSQEAGSSGWRQKADQEGFIAVFPDGIDSSWNVGNCCGQPFDQNIDDVGFARAIVGSLREQACIDPGRVYATGLSNGAGLAHRIACEAADVFAAIAAASADLVTDPCTPARPISELSIRGTADTLVDYDGGNVGSTGWYSPGAVGTFELWREIDGCSGSPATVHEYCQTHTECAQGVEVTLCTLPDVGHVLYSNALGFNVPDVAYEMFLRQPIR